MDSRLKNELDILIKIGEESGSLRTYTVEQLLNDLGLNTDEIFAEAIDYIEDSKKLHLLWTTKRKKDCLGLQQNSNIAQNFKC